MNSVVRSLNRGLLLPALGFSLGVGYFIRAWPDEGGSMTLQDNVSSKEGTGLQLQRMDVLEGIRKNGLYRRLLEDPDFDHLVQSEKIPPGHRAYHVGQGILFGPDKLGIDPVILQDTKRREVVIFYHFGADLANEQGQVHKGVLSLVLDEALCYCGFPTLPSKRGVTAKLDIDFQRAIPADSTIVLRAHVSEFKGRKCVIDGTLESVPRFENPWLASLWKPAVYASAKCILVEPKWFKYLNWLNVF